MGFYGFVKWRSETRLVYACASLGKPDLINSSKSHQILIYVPISGRGQLIKRGVADVLEDARLQSWKLPGDLKGYLEAFTNL